MFTVVPVIVLGLLLGCSIKLLLTVLYSKGFKETAYLIRLFIWGGAIFALFYENYIYVFICLIYGIVANIIDYVSFIYNKLKNKGD